MRIKQPCKSAGTGSACLEKGEITLIIKGGAVLVFMQTAGGLLLGGAGA